MAKKFVPVILGHQVDPEVHVLGLKQRVLEDSGDECDQKKVTARIPDDITERLGCGCFITVACDCDDC